MRIYWWDAIATAKRPRTVSSNAYHFTILYNPFAKRVRVVIGITLIIHVVNEPLMLPDCSLPTVLCAQVDGRCGKKSFYALCKRATFQIVWSYIVITLCSWDRIILILINPVHCVKLISVLTFQTLVTEKHQN